MQSVPKGITNNNLIVLKKNFKFSSKFFNPRKVLCFCTTLRVSTCKIYPVHFVTTRVRKGYQQCLRRHWVRLTSGLCRQWHYNHANDYVTTVQDECRLGTILAKALLGGQGYGCGGGGGAGRRSSFFVLPIRKVYMQYPSRIKAVKVASSKNVTPKFFPNLQIFKLVAVPTQQTLP